VYRTLTPVFDVIKMSPAGDGYIAVVARQAKLFSINCTVRCVWSVFAALLNHNKEILKSKKYLMKHRRQVLRKRRKAV